MAKMIPDRIDDSVPSSAERRIFELLKNDPGTSEWIALHSLGLARRPTGPYGEIDFVVIIPGGGIVCLEVKGGRVSCENGNWQTIDRRSNIAMLRKSPFMQARESMFALRQSIINYFGGESSVSRCPIGAAVVLPDIGCPPITPEFERSDVIDNVDLRRPISASINRVIASRLRDFQPRIGGRLPTPSDVKSLRTFLRPDFDYVVSKSVTLGRSDERLLQLTEEQYDRLDELDSNPRCLFEGAAGTGKTLLALEYARRADAGGSRVLFVCFNRLLGNWIKEQTRGTTITSGTWHEILRSLIVDSSFATEFQEIEQDAFDSDEAIRLFEEIYPLYGEIALEELDSPFDTLVVDEAQDLLDQSPLDLMNRALTGGLAGGRWAIFGDFTRQAIYGSNSNGLEILSEYSEHYVKAKLTLNCRNTQKIAAETSIIGGFEALPFRLGNEAGLPVDYRYWRNHSNLLGALSETIRHLRTDGIAAEDVMILSPSRLRNSALSMVTHIDELPLMDTSRSLDVDQECVRFSTIHSYKGLESRVVIIVDIDEIDDDRAQALLYVGMSRARNLLILFIHEHARGSVDARIRSALEKELKS